MRRLTHIFLMLLIFSVDVRLKAESVFFPQSCWGKKFPCAVENDSKQSVGLNLKGMSIHLGEHAILSANSESEASLTKGTLFAKHDGEFRWRTPYGQVICNDCELILKRDESSVEIHALKGGVAVQRKGDDEKYDLPAGFSVLLSAVMSDGKAALDFPQASALRPLAKLWAKVYVDTPASFKKELQEYVEIWKVAVETASQLHLEEAEREIASAAAEQRRTERLRQLRAAEDSKLRTLFREKNNL